MESSPNKSTEKFNVCIKWYEKWKTYRKTILENQKRSPSRRRVAAIQPPYPKMKQIEQSDYTPQNINTVGPPNHDSDDEECTCEYCILYRELINNRRNAEEASDDGDTTSDSDDGGEYLSSSSDEDSESHVYCGGCSDTNCDFTEDGWMEEEEE